MTFGSTDAIKRAVSANLGISPMPLSAVALELEIGLIKELQVRGKAVVLPYKLIYNRTGICHQLLALKNMVYERRMNHEDPSISRIYPLLQICGTGICIVKANNEYLIKIFFHIREIGYFIYCYSGCPKLANLYTLCTY